VAGHCDHGQHQVSILVVAVAVEKQGLERPWNAVVAHSCSFPVLVAGEQPVLDVLDVLDGAPEPVPVLALELDGRDEQLVDGRHERVPAPALELSHVLVLVVQGGCDPFVPWRSRSSRTYFRVRLNYPGCCLAFFRVSMFSKTGQSVRKTKSTATNGLDNESAKTRNTKTSKY
jgi:hypothetical protein